MEQRLEQIAARLINSTFDEIEQAAKEVRVSPIALFLLVNDLTIKKVRPDIWEELEDDLEDLEDLY